MKELITPVWDKNKIKLRNYFFKLSATELLQLSEPCYGPKLKKYENEIYALMALDKKTIQISLAKFYENSRVKGWLLESDPMTNLLILYMYYFLSIKDTKAFSAVMLYYNIRIYSNLYYKTFTFCLPNIFLYTIETINRSHIYAREKTIANAITHFSKEMIRRWEQDIEKLDNPDNISKFIRECRHRHSQSIKSFATAYYKNHEEGKNIGVDYESIMQDGDEKAMESTARTPKAVDKLIDKITMYGFVDKQALHNSQQLSKVNLHYAEKMANQLSNPSYHTHINFILKFYVGKLKKLSDLCSTGYIRSVRNLLKSRNETNQEFKNHIVELNQSLFQAMGMVKQYNSFTLQTRYAYISFITFYLTMTLRHDVCGKV